MKKIITPETIDQFAYVNLRDLSAPVRGVVISFFGLGYNRMCPQPPEEDDTVRTGKRLAEKGILFVFPYNNPWNWMNPQAVAFSDEILDVLFSFLHLPSETPVVAAGGSMGGQSALVFSRYTRYTPVACVTNCPVCDMPYHFTERPDLPRTLYSALWAMDMSMEEALRTISPLHLAESMPDIDYYIFHCEEDRAVNLEKHSGHFMEKMKHRRLTFHSVPGRGHCDLTNEMQALWEEYIVRSVDKYAKA